MSTLQRYHLFYGKWLVVDETYAKNECECSEVKKYEVGEEVNSIEAVQKQLDSFNDIRPKVYDKSSDSWVLLDSGSCVSCIPKSNINKFDLKEQSSVSHLEHLRITNLNRQ